jgi:hypothetical protein
MGLRASRSDRHPSRLYTWASTAQGHGVLWDAWREHAHSPTTRRIFIPAWRHDLNRVPQETRAIWDAYGQERLTDDEKLWMRVVKDAYDYEIPPEYVVWYRWKLATDMHGDEAMMCQEHPNLPEDAFQSFGDKFFRPALIRALRDRTHATPEPHGYRFEWDRWLDTSKLVPCAPTGDGVLTVWEEPDPEGVYIVSCHPAHSSSPTATTGASATTSAQNAAGRATDESAMRVKYIEDCMTELDKCLGGLIGLTLNNANITDAMNRRRGQLIVAKGHLSPVKSQD